MLSRFYNRILELFHGRTGERSLDAQNAWHSTGPDDDVAFADDFLNKWLRFASLGEEPNPTLGELTPAFEQALTRLLECGDRRAPARLVFYPVVQIGGDIPADSPLGRAALPVLGDDFPLAPLDDGDSICAPHLYFWWQENKSRFDSFPLFDDWALGDHARDFVVPMYHNVMQTEGLHPPSPESPDGG